MMNFLFDKIDLDRMVQKFFRDFVFVFGGLVAAQVQAPDGKTFWLGVAGAAGLAAWRAARDLIGKGPTQGAA